MIEPMKVVVTFQPDGKVSVSTPGSHDAWPARTFGSIDRAVPFLKELRDKYAVTVRDYFRRTTAA